MSRSPKSDALRVVLLGYMVRGPLGGLAWHHLHYAMGLHALGHDVYFFEDSEDYAACYDPSHDAMTTDPAYGLRFTADAFERVGLGDRWTYYDAHRSRWLGPCADDAPRICASADCLLNVSGVNPLRPWYREVPQRAFIDTDPALTQIRHLTDPDARALAEEHNTHFTFATNFGRPSCSLPDDGFDWIPTRQPVVPDAWPVTDGPADGPFTSVMLWEDFPAPEHGGVRYGMKSESFGEFMALPQRCRSRFELAVGSPSAPRTELASAGWRVRDPLPPSRDPWAYQRYLQSSKAEFGVAKEAYVVSHSGWFSERSTAYMASARPAVLHDTGFSDWLPTGWGLLAFSELDEAVAAVEEVEQRYAHHCRGARELVEGHFHYRAVLEPVLERTMAAAAIDAPEARA